MKIRSKLRWILGFIVLLIFDQATKFYFQGKNFEIIPYVFFIKYSENPGLIFGFFRNNWFFIYLLPVLVILILGYYFFRIKDKLFRLGSFFIITGIFSNFFGRVLYGYVIDWWYVPIYPMFNMTNSNLADIFIVAGVVLAIISLQKSQPKKSKNLVKSNR